MFGTKNERHILYMLVAFSVIALFVGAWLKTTSSLGSLFASELGIAGIIAFILIITIEKISKERAREETKKQIADITENVFNAIFKRYIPDPIFEEVEQSLFLNNVIRENYSLDYTLVTIDGGDSYKDISEKDKNEHFVCEINSSYRLVNITEKEVVHTIVSKIEMPIDKGLKDNVCFKCFKCFKCFILDGDEFVPDRLQGCVKESEDGNHMIFEEKVRIGPKSKVDINLRMKTIRRKTDQEVWASRIPSDGMKIRVNSPPSVKVEANANHSSKLEFKRISDNNLVKSQEWSLTKGIFPYQSVIFWWRDSDNVL